MESSDDDKVLRWTCVAVYFSSWLAILSWGFALSLLVPAALVAAIYTGMQYFEMTVRHHLALSGDSTAIPVTFLAVGAGALAAHYAGVANRDIFSFLMTLPLAVLGGHAAVFGIVLAMDKLGIDKRRS
jgi:hypothetical protein